MVKRKYLFLCLLLVLLSIAGVSASDADNITLQASTDMSDGYIVSDIDEISPQEGDDKLGDAIAANQADSHDILAVSDDENAVLGLAFKDLQKLVDDTPEGGELSLDNNYYVLSGGHAIHISKSITINGNNHYLDACEDGRIAIIEADGKSVVFKNIKFENGKVSDDGGAIYNDYSSTSLTIINCSFNNNKAGVDGGAIYTKGETKIYDSNFTNNQAYNNNLFKPKCYGGAIRSKGLITVQNSRFENNHAYNWGGAIYADNEIRITDSTFIGNSAKEAGAVYASTISQTVYKSTFLNNKATDGDGGAINIWNECHPDFVSCRFEGNTADNRGGAIYLDSTSAHLSVSYCTFVDNHANEKHYSGVIVIWSDNDGGEETKHAYGGHIIFNSGYYDLIDVCWFGTNNPDFNNQLVEYKAGTDDIIHTPSDYLKIGIEINETEDIHVGDKYKATVYFYDRHGGLGNDLLHSTGRFSGDANFSNLKVDYNDMTADAILTKENPEIIGELDHQKVNLKLTTNYTSGSSSYNADYGNDTAVKDNNTKHENKTTDNTAPEKAIKSTDKEMLKPTGNPIFALLLMLMTIGITTIRRF